MEREAKRASLLSEERGQCETTRVKREYHRETDCLREMKDKRITERREGE